MSGGLGRWVSLLSLSMALALLGGCGGPTPWAGLVKIGLVAPFEGQDTARGYAFLHGTKMALAEANQRGGVKGRRVELVALDEPGDGTMATYQARELAADPRVMAVLGHLTDGSALSAAEEYRRTELPLVTPATAETLSGPCLFRWGASDRQVTERALEYAQRVLGASRVVVVAEESAAVGPRSVALLRSAGRLGLAAESLSFPPRATEFGAIAERVKASGATAVLFWGDAEQAGLLLEALLSPRPALLFLGDGYRLSRLAPSGSAPLYYVTPFAPSDGGPPVPADFAAKYQGPAETAHLALVAYRASAAILEAVASAEGAPTRSGVRAALEAQSAQASAADGRLDRVHVLRLDGSPYPGRFVE